MRLIVAALLLAGGRVMSTLCALHRAHLLAIANEVRARARAPVPTELQRFLRSALEQGSPLRRLLNLMRGRMSASQPAPTQEEKLRAAPMLPSPKVTERLMRGVWRHGYRALKVRHG